MTTLWVEAKQFVLKMAGKSLRSFILRFWLPGAIARYEILSQSAPKLARYVTRSQGLTGVKRCDFGPGYGAGRTLSVRQVPNRPIGGVDFPAFDEHPRPVRLVSLEFVIQICGDQRCGSARSQRIPSL